MDAGQSVTTALIPDVLDVINAPGVVAACDQLVGDNWAIIPFTHNASFTSAGRNQHWHKDDNGQFNGRKQRHHQAVQIEMLYYPQAVRDDMGPTENRLANLRPQDAEVDSLTSHLQTDVLQILGELPIRSWEALVRGGLSSQTVSEIETGS